MSHWRVLRAPFLAFLMASASGFLPLYAHADPENDLFAKPDSAGPNRPDDDLGDIGGSQPPLSEEMIEKMAEQFGLPVQSPHVQKLVRMVEEARKTQMQGQSASALATTENVDDDDDADSPSRHVVIRHLRGKEGVPFPAKDEIPLPFKVTKDDIKRALEDHFAMVNKYVEQNTTPQKLPKCVENATTKLETGFPDDDKRAELISDMLFIDKKDVPLDPDEVFGKRTSLVSFDTQKENFEALPALGIGVDCLPYRFRVTRKYVFKDTGRNAFKNYDADQFGEGKFSEYMKAKLGLKD